MRKQILSGLMSLAMMVGGATIAGCDDAGDTGKKSAEGGGGAGGQQSGGQSDQNTKRGPNGSEHVGGGVAPGKEMK